MNLRQDANDRVMLLTLARPPANAMNHATVLELEAAFSQLARNPPSSGVILTGDGAMFSAGVDVREFADHPPQERRQMVLAITRMTAAALSIPCPLVSAINGHALGGGFVLTLCCDARIAVDDPAIKLGMPEARAGIPFPAGPLAIIRHEVPPGLLRRLTLASEIVPPRSLYDAGVIDGLAPRESLMTMAHERLARLAAQPGFRAVKQQIRGGLARELAALASSQDDPFLSSFE